MTIDKNDLLDSILNSLSRVDYIKSDDIPNIDLYMDQVTSFMEKHLRSTKRYDNDKILTKTMINNYAKNNLLPSPEKKKYSKDHLILLIFIYYFKNVLSMKDIETVLDPLTQKYFHQDSELNLAKVYDEICQFEKGRIQDMREHISKLYEDSIGLFSKAPDAEKEDLQLFSFICSLSFDVYMKRAIIEHLIDQIADSKPKK